jgi:small-conductance mechanosensitive channel
MDTPLLEISGFEVSAWQLVMCAIVLLAGVYLYARFYKFSVFDETDRNIGRLVNAGFRFRLALTLLLISSLLILRIVNFDFRIFEINGFDFTVNHLSEFLSLFSLALLADWVISHVVIRNRYRKREVSVKKVKDADQHNESNATQQVRYIVYLYLLQILLKRLNLDLVVFDRELKGELFTVHLSDLIVSVIILLLAKVLVWFITQVTLYRMYRRSDIDSGSQYAINQLVMYIIYVMAFLLAMERIVSDMSIIYGGMAALLVGVGLGLQQTFNDFFSGLVLLFERNVMVGDMLEIDGQVGKVLKIGLRASRIETKNSVSMLVPNSKLVNQAVINWTHNDDIVRFEIPVTVSFGEDPAIVKQLLVQVATNHSDILKQPAPFVRLNDFSDKGLLFTLYFFTIEAMKAEDIKSDLRLLIKSDFQQHTVKMPMDTVDYLNKTP